MGDMATPHRGAPRHTGLILAGLFVIPFASVTIAAQLGDVASTTDPRDAVAGGIALVVGVALGLFARHLVATIHARVVGMVRFVAATLRPLPGVLADTARFVWRVADGTTMPSFVFVPAETGRRGPPIHVR